MKIKYYILLISVTLCLETYCQTININSITTSRETDGDNGYTLDGAHMTGGSRPKLLNTSNFGLTGIYPKNISIFDGYGTTGSLTSISTVPINYIFFFGAFNKLDQSTQQFTTGEVDSLYNWSLRGGKLIITSGQTVSADNYNSDILNSKWGFSWTLQVPDGFIPTIDGNKTDIFNGPFGNGIVANQGGSVQGYFDTIPANSKVFANDTNGNPTLFMDCNTLALIIADVDGYTDLGGVTSGAAINNEQDEFWVNTIVFMDKLQPRPQIINNSNTLSLNLSYNDYQWYLNNIPINSAVNQTYSATEKGQYYVEVTVNGGCKVKSNNIQIVCLFKVNLGKDTIICSGSSLILNAGNPGSNYIWSTGDTTKTITVSNPGKYLVTVSKGNCIVKDSINISVNFSPQVKLEKDTAICTGKSLILNAGNPGSTYIWNTGATTQTITVSNTGKYLVTVSYGICSTTGSINVSIDSPPKVNLGKDTTICPGTELILNPHNDTVSFTWNDNSHNNTLLVNKSGIYSVTITDKSGCKNSDSINISQFPIPVLNLGKDTTICPGTELILNPHNDTVSYTWNDNSHNNTLIVNKTGKYSVTVTDKYGCRNSDTITISQYPVSYLNLGKDTSICDGCSIVLNAGNNFKEYKWQDGSNSPTYTVKTSGTYWVNVTDQYGCKYSDTIIVKEECDSDLFVPNVFTPNGDNINDIFKAVAAAPPCITNFNMKIFNRWGGLLNETDDINEGWDGKFRNENVPEGVYVYIITYYNINNSTSKLHKIGSVTLIR